MRGILMIEPLYHQTVAGNKTQTRRSGKLEVVNGRKAVKNKSGEITKAAIDTSPDKWEMVRVDSVGNAKFWEKNNALNEVWVVPRYAIDEVLYIKEPIFKAPWDTTYYRYSEYESFDFVRSTEAPFLTAKKKWSNKLFMPASAARAYIKITGIRCERLLDISDEDCLAEGIEKLDDVSYTLYGKSNMADADGSVFKGEPGKHHLFTLKPKESFLSLYKFANKVKEVPNLWVWCYEFEYLKGYKP
jgi:hypothetical protein